MKTLQEKIGKMTNLVTTLLVLLAGFVFLTGCQKDELAANGPALNSSTELSKNINTFHNDGQVPDSRSYTMLTIDHLAGKEDAPDYLVEVRSDETVLFRGRRNTTSIGSYKFAISDAAMTELRKLFIESNFAEMEDELPSGLSMPLVMTSFKSSLSSYAVTHVDAGREQGKLKAIREKAESILGISKYVSGGPMASPDKTTGTISEEAR